jgi:hypothetical protein
VDDLTTGAEKVAQSQPDGTKDYRPLGSGELADSWELGEFLEALGPVMRLPPKENEVSAAGSFVLGGTTRRRATILVMAAMAIVAGAAGAPPLMQAMRSSLPPPSGLHGKWTTPAERYAGRSFEVLETSLRLGVGGQEATYPIADVRRRDSSNAAIYTIRYRDGESTLEFALAIGPDSVAHIRNLPSVGWRKVQR